MAKYAKNMRYKNTLEKVEDVMLVLRMDAQDNKRHSDDERAYAFHFGVEATCEKVLDIIRNQRAPVATEAKQGRPKLKVVK